MISDMVENQATGYVVCVVFGMMAGLAAGIMRSILAMFKTRISLFWIYDISLWLGLSVAIIIANYVCCDGDIRLYIFLGFFSGFLLVYYTINWVAKKIKDYILGHMKKD